MNLAMPPTKTQLTEQEEMKFNYVWQKWLADLYQYLKDLVNPNGTILPRGDLTADSSYIEISGHPDDSLIGSGAGIDVSDSIKNAVSKTHDRLHTLNNASDHSSDVAENYHYKADSNGLPVQATNTDAEVAAAVAASHTKLHALNSASDHSSSIAQNYLMKADSSGLPAQSIALDDGTNFGIGTATPPTKLGVKETSPASLLVSGLSLLLHGFAHGVTTIADTRTYAALRQAENGYGGAELIGIGTGPANGGYYGLKLTGINDGYGIAPIVLNGAARNGTGTTENSLLLSVQNNGNEVIRAFGTYPDLTLEIIGDDPVLGVYNNTGSDALYGRSGTLRFYGTDSALSANAIATIVADHDSSSTDQLGRLRLRVNTGSGVVDILKLSSDKNVAMDAAGRFLCDKFQAASYDITFYNEARYNYTGLTHGITTVLPTDDYGSIQSDNTTGGGLRLTGISSSGNGIVLRAINTGGSSAALRINTQKDNGTGVTTIPDDGYLLSIENNASVKLEMLGNGLIGIANFIRGKTSLYRRYYHIPLGSSNPGASGASWVNPTANTLGGWRLTNASHVLNGGTDVHADWDGATDLTIEVKWECNVNNTGGADADTVDLKLIAYYKGQGETACKSQTVEVPTTIGKSAQYKQFQTTFTLDWDASSNVIEVGDVIRLMLNLETDTSEVDDIVINDMSISYQTTHVGIESGDT